jgi:hypothetical protein
MGNKRRQVELAVDQQAGDDRVGDADRWRLRCCSHASHHCRADHERQGDRGTGDQQTAQNLLAGCALHVRQILVAIAPPYQCAQRQPQHHTRQHPACEQ